MLNSFSNGFASEVGRLTPLVELCVLHNCFHLCHSSLVTSSLLCWEMFEFCTHTHLCIYTHTYSHLMTGVWCTSTYLDLLRQYSSSHSTRFRVSVLFALQSNHLSQFLWVVLFIQMFIGLCRKFFKDPDLSVSACLQMHSRSEGLKGSQSRHWTCPLYIKCHYSAATLWVTEALLSGQDKMICTNVVV